MRVQLVRAWPNRCDTLEVTLHERAKVGDALDVAGWPLDGEFVALAVFGAAASVETRLHPGDRIELLRPLQCDPMQARRLRAGKTGGRRG